MNTGMKEKGQKFRTLLVLAIVTILSLGVFLFRGNQVLLIIDGNVFEVVTNAKTVGQLAEEEFIIKENAEIKLDKNTEVEKGLEIEVKNPKIYTIDVNGLQLEITSLHTEVGDILKDAGVDYGIYDYSQPYLTEKVNSGDTIKYFHVNMEDEVEETRLPFKEKEVNNDKLLKGKTRISQEGKEGLKRTEIVHKYINGVLVESTIENEEVVNKAVDRIVEIGTMKPKPKPAPKPAAKAKSKAVTKTASTKASTSSSQVSKANTGSIVTMNASAYDLSYESTGKRPDHKYYGITASGTKARPGVVAVDPRVIPLGTKLYIESLDGWPDYGNAVAEDTGGAIKGNRIDLFFNSRSEALRFGRRNVKVHILD